MGTNGTLQSTIWEQHTEELSQRIQGQTTEISTVTQKIILNDGLSFHPQVVANTLYFLSTSEVGVTSQSDVEPNGTPLPATARSTSISSTPNVDPDLYQPPLDANLHGSVFSITLSGSNVGTESMLGNVGQSTGLQSGNSYVIWQDTSGYHMYDVLRQSDVTLNSTLDGAKMLAVNGTTTLWTRTNYAAGSVSGSSITLEAFNWGN
jgi:hypothetical protein